MQPAGKPQQNGISSASSNDIIVCSGSSANSTYLNGNYLAASLNTLRCNSSGNGSVSPGNGASSPQNFHQKIENPSHSPSLSPKSLPSSNDTLNSFSTGSSSGLGASLLPPVSSPTSNASLADYLSQLIRDKKMLASFPAAFLHVDRLLDEEINKVRVNLFQMHPSLAEPLVLPDAESDLQPTTLTEKVYIPAEEYPDFNFVGRILGPRGLTAKQLEKETQCKIMIRGKGSMRDKAKEAQMKGKPNWEHLNDKLHVLVTVEDTPERARIKMDRAVDEIKKLLVPISENDDELKKRQLLELAIINGTYRDSSPKPPQSLPQNISQMYIEQAQARLQFLANLQAAQRMSPAIGAPLMMQTQQRPVSAASSGSTSYYAQPTPLSYTVADPATAHMLASPEYAAYYSALNPQFFTTNGEYMVDPMHGQFLHR